MALQFCWIRETAEVDAIQAQLLCLLVETARKVESRKNGEEAAVGSMGDRYCSSPLTDRANGQNSSKNSGQAHVLYRLIILIVPAVYNPALTSP